MSSGMPLVEGSLALPLALSAAALLGGTLATWLYDRWTPLPWRLAAGFCTGLAAFGLVGFALALRFGLHTWVVTLAGVTVCTPAGLLLSASYRSAVAADVRKALDSAVSGITRIRPRTLIGVTVCSAGTLLLWRVADRVMFVRPDGIHTGIIHNYGDLPFHLTVTSRFVYGANLPPEHPAFAGAAFIYPFLTDFIGAMYVRAGLPVREVIVWSTLLLCLALGALLHRWTRDLTGRDDAAYLAPLLAFLSGGFGWWMFVAEAGQPEASLRALLAHLPHDYTITYDGQYRWGNIVTTLLTTQRGLLLGLPLAVVVFHQWWLALADSGEDRRAARARMIAAGGTAGLLPLVHAHSFAVVLGVALCLALLSGDRRTWAPFFVCSLALGLPQVWWLTHSGGIRGGSSCSTCRSRCASSFPTSSASRRGFGTTSRCWSTGTSPRCRSWRCCSQSWRRAVGGADPPQRRSSRRSRSRARSTSGAWFRGRCRCRSSTGAASSSPRWSPPPRARRRSSCTRRYTTTPLR
jgi:hypothetical protein